MSMDVDVERYTVTLPDMADHESVQAFLAELSDHKDVRGVVKLQGLIDRIVDHQRIAAKQLEQAHKTANYINGIRTYTSEGGKVKSLRGNARKFFDSLDTTALRVQCKFYQVDYEAYEEVDERLEALVNAYMERLSE